jgi:hypothetical protein
MSNKQSTPYTSPTKRLVDIENVCREKDDIIRSLHRDLQDQVCNQIC